MQDNACREEEWTRSLPAGSINPASKKQKACRPRPVSPGHRDGWPVRPCRQVVTIVTKKSASSPKPIVFDRCIGKHMADLTPAGTGAETCGTNPVSDPFPCKVNYFQHLARFRQGIGKGLSTSLFCQKQVVCNTMSSSSQAAVKPLPVEGCCLVMHSAGSRQQWIVVPLLLQTFLLVPLLYKEARHVRNMFSSE